MRTKGEQLLFLIIKVRSVDLIFIYYQSINLCYLIDIKLTDLAVDKSMSFHWLNNRLSRRLIGQFIDYCLNSSILSVHWSKIGGRSD